MSMPRKLIVCNLSLCFVGSRPASLGTISPGDLVQFSSAAAKHYFFIGPLLKKPIVQVLVEAHVDADRAPPHIVHMLPRDAADNDIPRMCTTQQFFQNLLEASGRIPCDSIPFRVCKYTVTPHQSALSVLLLEVGEDRFEISQVSPVKRAPKPKGTIAFGLKPPPKKRKPRATAKQQAKKQKSAEGASTQPPYEAEAMLPPCSSSSGGGSSSSSDSTSQSEAEAERPYRTGAQRDEEQETNRIIRAHFQDPAAASSTPAVSSKDVHQDVQPAKTRTGRPAVQCNPKIGIREVSVQTANRLAKCRFCLQPICKTVTRIGYAYSLSKFHAYLHHKCFASFLVSENGDVQEALAFLKQWVQKARAGGLSGKEAVPDSAIPDVEAVIEQLRRQQPEAKSSGASSSHCGWE